MAAKKKTSTKKKAAAKRKSVQRKARTRATKKAAATAPKPGTTITREFKGQRISVRVTDESFVYRGKTYASLTALALEITGYKAVSGPRFFGLVQPKAKGK